MIKRKATGVLGTILSNIDKQSLKRTRNKMLLAAKIADAMKAKGLTQKQMAERMGKTESEISEWLSGNRNFTVDTLTDIEAFLEIHLIDTVSFNVLNITSAPLKKMAENKNVLVVNSTQWISNSKNVSKNNIFVLEAS